MNSSYAMSWIMKVCSSPETFERMSNKSVGTFFIMIYCFVSCTRFALTNYWVSCSRKAFCRANNYFSDYCCWPYIDLGASTFETMALMSMARNDIASMIYCSFAFKNCILSAVLKIFEFITLKAMVTNSESNSSGVLGSVWESEIMHPRRSYAIFGSSWVLSDSRISK